MIWLAVRSLSRLEALTAALVDLGARHAAYDMQEAHFAVNKRALIETLREALGSPNDAGCGSGVVGDP